ncbi:hypothetical protein PsorP6_007948 [Peronosclerospora sorghi]|uniref:Uncharacterized protein n=1 Tax=Peronosclerospora sorghi TaxID=230839 RepID=A0ACC0W8E6_9STRA|nr:hypothetical protein PsorP6_007948 [Peronosclerospora sorghi]
MSCPNPASTTRLSRMRTLSALLDEALDKEENLPDNCRALFASMTAVASNEPTHERTDLCTECQAQGADVFCEQCHDYFCDLCCTGQHRKGNRRAHTFQPVAQAAAAAEAVENDVSDDDHVEAASSAAAEEEEEEVDDDKVARGPVAPGASVAEDSDGEERAGRRNLCNLMGYYLLGYPSSLEATHNPPVATPGHAASVPSVMLELAKFLPVRLTYEERKRLRTLEAALRVSSYTDKLDTLEYVAPAKRVRAQLQEIYGFLAALAVAAEYKAGQELLREKNFADSAAFFQELFELGRRYKIMNPEKMRGEYGKLMYLVQDAVSPAIQELLGFSCVRKIRTVYDVLEAGDALEMLQDGRLATATMVVAPDGKSRAQIQRQLKQKAHAIRGLTTTYASRAISRETLEQCLYSIADNQYHLYFERDPIDRMITLLTTHFDPDNEDVDRSLAIVSGNDGARLSHSHARQYHYVLQSLTLWREIVEDLFRFWCLTDEDLLADGTRYELTDTGQGLHRIQAAPRVSRAVHVILHATQRRLDAWVGSSVIHLGDKNVPNALMFIDKYTQVGHILRPIIKTVDHLESLCASSTAIADYVTTTFDSVQQLQRAILADFFREAFDGSGGDNFFDAGSCIDGRLTSAWHWCSNLHGKPFFPIFKMTGFVGFDGKFG